MKLLHLPDDNFLVNVADIKAIYKNTNIAKGLAEPVGSIIETTPHGSFAVTPDPNRLGAMLADGDNIITL